MFHHHFHHLSGQNWSKSATQRIDIWKAEAPKPVENSGFRSFCTCIVLTKKIRQTKALQKGESTNPCRNLSTPLVHLSENNSKNYATMLRFKRKLAESGELPVTNSVSDQLAVDYKEINEFGEVAVRQVQKIQKRFTPREIAVLAREYQEGKSTRELAQQFGCHRNTVSNVLKRNGFEVRGRGRQAQGG